MITDLSKSTKVLSKESAARIWKAHREIETATELLRDLKKAIKEHREPNPQEPFAQDRFELGVPMSSSSHRLFNVNRDLAVRVIEAHIANQQKELADASIAAAIELECR